MESYVEVSWLNGVLLLYLSALFASYAMFQPLKDLHLLFYAAVISMLSVSLWQDGSLFIVILVELLFFLTLFRYARKKKGGKVMDIMDVIKARLLQLCGEKNLSINKLATMSGVPYSTINSILRGKSKSPTLATLIRIATAFNMTITEFLDIPQIVEFSFDDEEDLGEE